MAPVFILVLLALLLLLFIFLPRKKKSTPLSKNDAQILAQKVSFYQRLDKPRQKIFENKVNQFLHEVRLEGIGVEIEEADRVLVAASAVIPVFYFQKYRYYNLNTVLLYPGNFNKTEFLQDGFEKNVLGMVGTGALQGSMILSKPALHFGFDHVNQPHNTGIHEFVHLLDKEDGDVDGLPETLLQRKDNREWLDLVDENIAEIAAGRSDIDPYAASGRAEFFAVVSEYFFNHPDRFKIVHPSLYTMLKKIYEMP